MEEATSQITQGAIRAAFENDGANMISNPVLQCVQIKSMEAKRDGTERYRVVLSDIRNFIQCMIAQPLNHVVTSGKLKRGSLIRIKAYTPNMVKDKRIFILIDLDVLEQYGEPPKLGEPVGLELKPDPQDNQQAQPKAISSSSFYGNQSVHQQPQPQPQSHSPSLPSRSTTISTPSHGNIYPIEALSPYAHKWTIKARCTQKSAIKEWHKPNSTGKLFSVNLLDDTGEIRATAFNEHVDSLYNVFQEGSVYYISSPCTVRLAKKMFSNVNNDYELTFERDTLVEKCEDQDNLPQVRYNFTSIGDLESVEKDTTIDTIGVLKETGEVSEIVSKTTGKPYAKRDLTVVDNSLRSVRLTIWGNTAHSFDAPIESVIAFKGVKVSDFGGRSLSLLSSGSMTVDPDIDEAHKLKGWYDAEGRQDNFISHAATMEQGTIGGRQHEYKTIKQIKDENIGVSDGAQYFNLKATIAYIKQENFCYPACQTERCNKKLVEVEEGGWHCVKCEKTFPQPHYRFVLTAYAIDHTGHLHLNCFDDTGRVVMGMSADDLYELSQDSMNPMPFADVISEATCKTYNFRCQAKMDTYQDQQRIRYSVMSAAPLNYSLECTRLVEILKQYNSDSDGMFVN